MKPPIAAFLLTLAVIATLAAMLRPSRPVTEAVPDAIASGPIAPPAAAPAPAAPRPAHFAEAQPAPLAPPAPKEPIPSALKDAKPSSKAPWSSRRDRYRAGDFAWLVENARAAPEAGSYSYALQAIDACLGVLAAGTEAEQRLRIEREPSRSTRAARLEALERLFSPCRGLGDAASLRERRIDLAQDMATAHDARATMQVDAFTRLRDTELPRLERQRRLVELLEMDDPEIASTLGGIFQAGAATFEGEPIPAAERGAFTMAWDVALCTVYGDCPGRDSRRAQGECVRHGDCDYLDPMTRVRQSVPAAFVPRIESYYLRIHAALSTRAYSAFGIP